MVRRENTYRSYTCRLIRRAYRSASRSVEKLSGAQANLSSAAVYRPRPVTQSDQALPVRLTTGAAVPPGRSGARMSRPARNRAS